jgi:hypothetical protein
MAWEKGTVHDAKSGKGIRLGDSREKVMRILGKRTSSTKVGELITWTYKCTFSNDGIRLAYFGSYAFLRGSLDSIHFVILGGKP